MFCILLLLCMCRIAYCVTFGNIPFSARMNGTCLFTRPGKDLVITIVLVIQILLL